MNWNSGRLWLKISVYTLLTLGILFVAILTLFFTRFDADSARRNLERSLADSGRTLSIGGTISPMLLPSPGLEISEVRVSEQDGKTPFAHVAQIEARLAWLPLLFGRLEITHVALHDAQLTVVRQTDGSLNFADLLRSRPSSKFMFNLDSLAINGTRLEYQDRVNGQLLKLEDASLLADELRANAQMAFGGRLQSGGRLVNLSLTAPFTRNDDQIDIPQFSATAISSSEELGEIRANASGKLQLNLATLLAQGEALKVAIDTTKPSSHSEILIPTVSASLSELSTPAASLSGNISYQRTQYRFSSRLAQLQLNQNGLFAASSNNDFSWSVGPHSLNMVVQAPLKLAQFSLLSMSPLTLSAHLKTPELPRGQLRATLQGALEGDLADSRLNLRVSGELDGAKLASTITQYGFVAPRHEATLSIGKLDLNRYLPEQKAEQAVALFQNDKPFRLDWMDFINVQGKLAIGELAVGNFRVNGINADVTGTPQQLQLDNLTADIYEGHLTGRATLFRERIPRLTLQQELTGMQIRPLMLDLFAFSRIEGSGNGWVQLEAKGQSLQALRNTLNGQVAARLERGALTGIDLVAALRDLPGESERWNGPVSTAPDQKTTFSALSAQFELQDGVARNQDMKLASSLVNVRGSGKFDLTQSIIDYTLDVQANPSAFARLGGISIPLKITGPLQQPVYSLDFNAMVKGKKTEGEKQQVLKQELGKQITSILPVKPAP